MKKKRTASQVGKFSRRKGKSFERWCARYFTQWTGLKWETTRNSGRTDLKGDIYCLSRPDLPLVVECKNDKRYSVHAMLKPTKAFTDMINKTIEKSPYDPMFIIKNETGIWIPDNYKKEVLDLRKDVIVTRGFGIFIRLQHLDTVFEVDGVKFDASRMDSVGEEGEG